MDMNDTECSSLANHPTMRKRYFHSDFCENYLFKSWYIGNISDAIITACAVYILAILYEGLKSLRNYLSSLEREPQTQPDIKEDQMKDIQNTSFEVNVNEHPDDSSKQQLIPNTGKSNKKSSRRGLVLLVVQSLLHVLQIGLAYILMFAAMTFNVYLFVSVCIGMGTGYLIFTKIKWIKEQM